MSDDYILKYTNGYANYSKKIEESELEIDGECKIMNYDPRENPDKDSIKKGSITINFSDDEESIEIGNGRELVSTEKANFSKKKYSIFAEIAALDGDAKELSVDDIKKMDKSLIEKWGLKDLRYDYRNGVATLVWGENDILRIDFKTWQERWLGESKYSKVKSEEKTALEKENSVEDIEIVGTYKVKQGDTLGRIAKRFGLYTWELTRVNKDIADKNVLSLGTELQIPKSISLKTKEDLSENGKDFLKRLIDFESRGRGEYKAENWAGYLGAYQMGKKALNDLGIYKEKEKEYINDKTHKKWEGVFIKENKFGVKSVSDFLNSPEKQDKAIIRYMQLTWSYIKQNNLDKYVGREIAGVKITELGLIAGCHLVGRGDVEKFLKSNGRFIPKDGNNRPVTVYLGDPKLMGENIDFRFT